MHFSGPAGALSSLPANGSGSRPSVSTLGEAILRLSVKGGDRLEDASTYEVHVAGAEANVAFALARIGVPCRWTSVLPRNILGRRVASTLSSGGVDISTVRWVDDARLGMYFVEFAPSPRTTQVVYDRTGSAMANARVADFDWDQVFDATAFHVTGISFALSPSARGVAHHAVTEAHRRGLAVSFDVNYRRQLWDRDDAADTIRSIAPLLKLLICPAGDAAHLFGVEGTHREVAEKLRSELGPQFVVVTDGPTGAAGAGEGATIQQPAYQVDVVEPIGAGDAFAAGVLWGLLTENSLQEGLERGVAMAALKMTLRGDLFRLGIDEVKALQAGRVMEINR
jgi:2-dehydro-3-deoxygluconokinase